MTILDTIPDNKGGQLKFRVNDIDCRTNGFDDIPAEGIPVEIYIKEDGSLLGARKTLDMQNLIYLALTFGRPKGFGVIMWNEGTISRVHGS